MKSIARDPGLRPPLHRPLYSPPGAVAQVQKGSGSAGGRCHPVEQDGSARLEFVASEEVLPHAHVFGIEGDRRVPPPAGNRGRGADNGGRNRPGRRPPRCPPDSPPVSGVPSRRQDHRSPDRAGSSQPRSTRRSIRRRIIRRRLPREKSYPGSRWSAPQRSSKPNTDKARNLSSTPSRTTRESSSGSIRLPGIPGRIPRSGSVHRGHFRLSSIPASPPPSRRAFPGLQVGPPPPVEPDEEDPHDRQDSDRPAPSRPQHEEEEPGKNRRGHRRRNGQRDRVSRHAHVNGRPRALREGARIAG